MYIKKIAFFLAIFLLFFLPERPLLASQRYGIEPVSVPCISFQTPLGVQASNEKNVNLEELYWVASFFIPGSGQLILGEDRGIFFFFVVGIALGVVGAFVMVREFIGMNVYPHDGTGTASTPYPTPIEMGALLAFIGLYTWNIVDAYLLNAEVTHKKTQDDAMRLNQDLKAILRFADQNKVHIGGNGITFQTRLATF